MTEGGREGEGDYKDSTARTGSPMRRGAAMTCTCPSTPTKGEEEKSPAESISHRRGHNGIRINRTK